ncbi:Uncharacterised protein [Weissella viridescens]|uniref:DNA polymerase III delta subunit-like C-terminal domain-containing protein n=1 Tax=Weissella viridescens TaxID=1629 RepID=A0A380P0K7_WEIVI|nr:Uncharacterised protein [Weissella viridescens]
MISQFRLLIQVKTSKQSEQGLATALKVHPYRVKLAKRLCVASHIKHYLAHFRVIRDGKRTKINTKDPEMLFELFVLRYQNDLNLN